MRHDFGGMRHRPSALSRLRVAALLVSLSIALALAGCRPAAPPAAEALDITLHASTNPAEPPYVEVRGLSAADLASLRAARLTSDAWAALLKVTVGEQAPSDDVPPVQGRYTVTETSVSFTPLFPFDPGRAYRVAFDPGRLPRARPASGTGVLVAVVRLPARATAPATVVTAVHPSAGVMPENVLRMYIDFSAPMGNGVARNYLRILDRAGREVAIPFLPVDADFWNPDHTRCTVFFDPGRVKQGILPNTQLGRPLQAGQKYTLEISSDWRDADGRPLGSVYRREFRVGPAHERAIMLSSWRIRPPALGTREPLVVVFPSPLDHALAARAIGVEGADRRRVDGDVELEADDTRWRFTPLAVWQGGGYNLVASSVLEDPAGNRIGSPFEAVGNSKGREAPDEFRVGFTIGGAAPKKGT